jgi:arabinofuranosyltransferase
MLRRIMTQQTSRRLFGLLLILYAGWCIFYIYRSSFVAEGSRVFMLWDDAFVSMRYARNLASGHGLVWNPGGERVQGYSNLGITLFMAALHLLPISAQKIALVFQLVNLGLLLACAALTRDIAEKVFDGNRVVGLAAGGLVALSGPLGILSLQGTDVGVTTAILLGAVAWVIEPLRKGAPWPPRVFLLLASGILVRIDFTLTYLLFAAVALRSSSSRRTAVAAGAPLVVTVAGVLGLGAWYYGDPLPNTYYLKTTGASRMAVLKSSLEQLQPFLNARVLPVLAFTMVAAFVYYRRDRVVSFLLALFWMTFAYNFWVGGDWVFPTCSRFLAPVLPLYIVLFVGSAFRLVDGARSLERLGPRGRAALFGALALVSCVGFNTSVSLKEWVTLGRPPMRHAKNEAAYHVAVYLRDHARPGTTIGVHGAGIIPYFADLPALDVLGKCDPHIARTRVDTAAVREVWGHDFVPGHSKFDWDYVMNERRPDLLDSGQLGLDRRADFRALYRLAIAREEGYGEMRFFVRRGAEEDIRDPDLRLEDPGPPRARAAEPMPE